MSEEQKERAGDYEITQSCIVGRKRFVIGECQEKPEQYMVASHRTKFDGMFSEYYDVGISEDYMEILAAFIQRQKDELEAILQQRSSRGSDGIPYTAADCLPNIAEQDLTGQIVVIKADALDPEFRVKEEQLMFAISGNGCKPDARGTKVFGRDCYTGEKFYMRRAQIAGVLKPALVPPWAGKNVLRFQDEIRENLQKEKHSRGEER